MLVYDQFPCGNDVIIEVVYSFKNLVCIAKHEVKNESGSIHLFQSKVGDLNPDSIEALPHVFESLHVL